MHLRKQTNRRVSQVLVVGLAGALLATACGGTPSASQTSTSRDSLADAIGSLDPSQEALYVANISGYFAAENLSVSITRNISSIPPVLSGQADIGSFGPAMALQPVRDGKDTSIILAHAGNGIAGFVVGSPQVNDITHCGRMSTLPVGTSVYAWTILYKKLFRAGFAVANLGDAASAIATVVSGQSDCAVIPLTNALTAISSGKLHLIFDPRVAGELPSGFPKAVPEGVEWGLTNNLKQKRTAVVKFERAILRAVAFIKNSSATDIATILRKDPAWQTYTQEQLSQALDAIKAFEFPNDGYIGASSWPETIDFLYQGGQTYLVPSDPKWSYDQRVDMSYYTAAGGKVQP
jgi:ABC-type nitrate/sulfonate/bicarbonate transport system substrate-binding protein